MAAALRRPGPAVNHDSGSNQAVQPLRSVAIRLPNRRLYPWLAIDMTTRLQSGEAAPIR
jgi:hypothetical protein